MRAVSWLPMIGILFLPPPGLHGQVLEGQLLDEVARTPIVAALIEITGLQKPALLIRVMTDSAGRFRAVLPSAATYRIEASRIAYSATIIEAFSIAEGETVQVELRMGASALPVEPILVTARSSSRNRILEAWGFYERQRLGRGSFLTREDITARQAYFVSDLFRGMRGFRLVPNRSGTGWIVASARDSRCLPDVYINGVKTSRVLTPSDDPVNVLRPEQLEGIEAFQGASSIPHQYNPRGTACSVILLWTGEK